MRHRFPSLGERRRTKQGALGEIWGICERADADFGYVLAVILPQIAAGLGDGQLCPHVPG